MIAKIKAAVAEYKRGKALDRELELALIDPGFINRAILGITPEISSAWRRLDAFFRGHTLG